MVVVMIILTSVLGLLLLIFSNAAHKTVAFSSVLRLLGAQTSIF